MMNFSSAQVFSVKKADNGVNFAAGGIINCRTPYSIETGKKH
jgi:hypothetical protein